jgi:MSHA biogenesis protein MshN
MSLVNDMLRDLESRRAAPNERLQLDGLYAVDERGAARRDRSARLRRVGIAVLVLVLLLVVGSLLYGRVVGEAPVTTVIPAAIEPSAALQSVQVLDILPQHDARGLVLQVLLDRSTTYQRVEENGSVSLRLSGAQWQGDVQSGRVQRDGRSLSWRVENAGSDVQILVVGLGDSLDVRDRLEPAGERWMLWLEVPLNPITQAAEPVLVLDHLPTAQADMPAAEPALPAWANAPVPAPTAEPRVPEMRAEAPISAPAAPARKAEVKIAAHQPDAVALARQALQDGDSARAINLLEPLQHSSSNPEAKRWLARAYLAAGDQQRLLDWLPAQLAQQPHDSELRLLLARAQLHAGETRSAVATLEQNPPRLEQDPTYFALLAASYQQTEQWQNSAELYQRMIALRPSQSTWQLGLAIALEQLDQPAEAGRHYRLALQGSGLDESARRFASERATALGGR